MSARLLPARWRELRESLALEPDRIDPGGPLDGAIGKVEAWLARVAPDAPAGTARRLVLQQAGHLFPAQARPNTADIVDLAVHRCLQPGAPRTPTHAAYADWKIAMERWLADTSPAVVPALAGALPLRDEVCKLVFAMLAGRMPFSREYVLKHYEQTLHGKPFLLFPAPAGTVRRLVVLFSGFAGRKTFNRYSWYWDESEAWQGDTARLFLCDESSHWYVGPAARDERGIWHDIILSTLKSLGLQRSQAITLGGSMGGYGALRHAIELGLRAAIAVNPQLDLRSALRYKEDSWERQIRACGPNFQDIADLIHRHESRPVLYLEHSQSPCDRSGVTEVLQALREHGGLVIEHTTRDRSDQSDRPSREQIESLIRFVESFPQAGTGPDIAPTDPAHP